MRSRLVILLFATWAGSAGCKASCKEACRALVACDGSVEHPGSTQAECEAGCARQEAQYEAWEDEELLEAFDAQRNCVRDSSCSAIASGECYDEELFAW